jgi:ribonuclease VapC
MVRDSSALVAVVLGEPDSSRLLARMRAAAQLALGAPALAEALLVLSRRVGGDPRPFLAGILVELDVEVIPFTDEHARVAVDACIRFGEGRHPAGLNFGDCLTYAAAAVAGEPLLYKGDDFARTDLAGA